MIISFNENNNNLISKNKIINFKKYYPKSEIRINGYIDNIKKSIDYNYKIKSSLNYISENSYFITVTFNSYKINIKNNELSEKNSSLTCSNADKSALLVYEFRDFYNKFTREFSKDRNFMKPRPQPHIPITYVFLDAEGTRWGTYRDEYKNPHVHALMVIPNHMHQEFEATMRKFGADWKMDIHSCISTMDVQRVTDYGLGNLTVPYVLSYASKLIPENAKQLIYKVDQEFLPRHSDGNLDFYN